MQNEDTRNTTIFIVLAVLLLVGYQYAVLEPAQQRKKIEAGRQAPPVAAQTTTAPQAAQLITREAALAASPRVPIETPALRGSLSLRGGRFDDLYLAQYRQ